MTPAAREIPAKFENPLPLQENSLRSFAEFLLVSAGNLAQAIAALA
jgi:hypothetical protein